MSKVSNNVELLKAMDTVVMYLNDESAEDGWRMVGVPDGACGEDYEDMASDDDCMESACACFGRIMRRFSKDGWFTNYEAEPPFVAYGVVE